jgi:hypothetical protein
LRDLDLDFDLDFDLLLEPPAEPRDLPADFELSACLREPEVSASSWSTVPPNARAAAVRAELMVDLAFDLTCYFVGRDDLVLPAMMGPSDVPQAQR